MQLSPKLGLQKTQFFSIISTKIIVIGTLSYKVFCDKKQNGSLLSPVCTDIAFPFLDLEGKIELRL